MSNKNNFDPIEFQVKTGRSRQRPRSTVFNDGVDKMERRQQRRQSEKQDIDDELLLHEEITAEEYSYHD